MRKLNVLVLHAEDFEQSTLSYRVGWPQQFKINPSFNARVINISALGRVGYHWLSLLLKSGIARYDAIILLHSVFSNSCLLSPAQIELLANLRPLKVFFIGNEYKLMPEKMEFCKRINADLLISQCNAEQVLELYRGELGCRVECIPNTGVDFNIFHPALPDEDRRIDIGYRSFQSPPYLGHDERKLISDLFLSRASRHGLSVDISLDPADRLGLEDWARFLNNCKAQIGTEAGGDYFDLEDKTRTVVNEYTQQHPEAGFEEIQRTFFAGRQDQVPIRIISGRNIEAAATKTAQILLEGRYNGYFQPDVHYIPLKKDFSNFDEAVAKFKDPGYRGKIAGNAYDLARNEFTYDALLARLYRMLREMT